MAKREKLLAKLRRSSKDASPEDIRALLTKYGFEMEERSNHTFFTHPKYPRLFMPVARHRTLAVGYVEQAVGLVDELLRLENREARDENE